MRDSKNRRSRRQFIQQAIAAGGAAVFSFSPEGQYLINSLMGKPTSLDVLAKGLSRQNAATFTYNGLAAAQYAGYWALNVCDIARGPCFDLRGDDCTNFASKSLAAGGFPMDNTWFASWNWWTMEWTWSTEWSVAPQLRAYLLDYGYGSEIGTDSGTSTNPITGLAPGDLLFYDWGQGEGISHVAVLTTPSPYGDDLVDQHSVPLAGAFWTLETQNQYRDTTTIHFVHINNNTATAQCPA
jgi:hypothetical protein